MNFEFKSKDNGDIDFKIEDKDWHAHMNFIGHDGVERLENLLIGALALISNHKKNMGWNDEDNKTDS